MFPLTYMSSVLVEEISQQQQDDRMHVRNRNTHLPYTDDSVGDEDEQNDKRFNKCSDCVFIFFEEG